MAAEYPTDDERQRPNQVYINPPYNDYYDRERIPERMNSAMDRTAQYVSGLNPDANSYSTDDYSDNGNHHHHHHHQHIQHDQHNQPTLPVPALAIRRHPPGSNDPRSQNFANDLQSASNNISSSTNVHVTIKRNPILHEQLFIQPDQTVILPDQTVMLPNQPVIQPVYYPVPVYVDPPAPQYPQYPMYPQMPPIQIIQPIKEIIIPSTPKKPATPAKVPYTPPMSPKKPVSHVTTSITPPVSPNRYETEIFHTPSPPPPPPPQIKYKHVSPRRPIRAVVIKPPPPPRVERRIVRPAKHVVEEFDDYDEHFRVPTAYAVPKKVVAYRTVPGMTTRELENEEMNHTGRSIYVKTPKAQTVTYRVS